MLSYDHFNIKSIEFSLNVFTEFAEFSDKNTLKGLKPATSHVRDNSASKIHVWDKIFKLSPIHASVIYQISWICWIHWIHVQFRENSNVKLQE